MTAPVLRVLVADDEPLARERVAMLLDEQPDVQVVASCASGREALEAILALRPDIAFLDIRMPELDGFEVLEALPPERRPAVVFVTAYDAHALRAFEVRAVDYLLKPLQVDRFHETLARLRALRHPEVRPPDLELLLADYRRQRGAARRLVARRGRSIQVVPVESITRVVADGNYLTLHTTAGTATMRETLSRLAERLDPERFLRIHRSVIVNLEQIRAVEPYFHGEYTVTLSDGATVMASRTFSEQLRRWMR
ncbi:MAG: LytTR family DNA-binding domain-containing protein [Gemmatimonadetes bacterium]|nr:LytTR family DNA-binding domain-containing protein [Gemmatimonadota bacterium]